MLVIPVLDIMGGVVVHALGGDRAAYRPIETPLAPGRSDPVSILRGYRSIHPFETVYVADLDGIGGRERNHDAISALRLEFPDVVFWVDDGSATVETVAALARTPNMRPVVGSESLGSMETLAAIRAEVPDPILSLDFKGGAFLGPEALLHSPGLWFETVIAMTLAAVGSGAGPDLACIRHLRASKPDGEIFAAGGIRVAEDLRDLAVAGAAGALVASALHAGTIKAGDLDEVPGPG